MIEVGQENVPPVESTPITAAVIAPQESSAVNDPPRPPIDPEDYAEMKKRVAAIEARGTPVETAPQSLPVAQKKSRLTVIHGRFLGRD
jgi:hypothetical protein